MTNQEFIIEGWIEIAKLFQIFFFFLSAIGVICLATRQLQKVMKK